jgi:hypothetical protein
VSRKPIVLLALIVSLSLAASASAASLAGKWVASAPGGKIVLTLKKSGAVYKGTYVQGRKKWKVVARGGNADGASQVTLTLTPGKRSTMCGLQGAKLYCQTPTGTAAFSRA